MPDEIVILDLLKKKRNGDELTPEEINFFIQNVVSEKVQGCQIGKILLSIKLPFTLKAEM
jgi:thymidine phosphorylase